MTTDRPILDLVNEYLRNSDIRDNSRKKYRDNIYYFIGWLTRNTDDVRKAARADVLAYKRHLMDRKLSPATIDNYLVVVRQFYRYLESMGYSDDIASGVRSPGKASQDLRKEYLNPDQVKQMLSVIDRSSLIGKRNYAIVYLMVTTGVRCIEVSRLNVEHFYARHLMVTGKGRYIADRKVSITEDMYKTLVEYLEDRQETSNDAPLFVNHHPIPNCYVGRITPVSISKIVKRLLRSMKLDSPRLTAHSLRHTAAINALKAGCTLIQVRDMLGHRSVLTTDIYTRAIEAENNQGDTPVRRLEELYKTA